MQRLTRVTAPMIMLFAATACVMVACASQSKPTDPRATQAALTEFRKAALVEIQDPARAQEVSALIDELAAQDLEARNAVAVYRQRLLDFNANYDAAEGDFNKLFADFNDERLTRQQRFRLKSQLTREQWAALHRTPASDSTNVSLSRGVAMPNSLRIASIQFSTFAPSTMPP